MHVRGKIEKKIKIEKLVVNRIILIPQSRH